MHRQRDQQAEHRRQRAINDLIKILANAALEQVLRDHKQVESDTTEAQEEREAALAGLAGLGTPSCLYYFSVLLAVSKHRRYFTCGGFIQYVTAHFNIIDIFPSVIRMPPALDAVRRILPSHVRISILKNWTATRRAEDARHLGCLAVKCGSRMAQLSGCIAE